MVSSAYKHSPFPSKEKKSNYIILLFCFHYWIEQLAMTCFTSPLTSYLIFTLWISLFPILWGASVLLRGKFFFLNIFFPWLPYHCPQISWSRITLCPSVQSSVILQIDIFIRFGLSLFLLSLYVSVFMISPNYITYVWLCVWSRPLLWVSGPDFPWFILYNI